MRLCSGSWSLTAELVLLTAELLVSRVPLTVELPVELRISLMLPTVELELLTVELLVSMVLPTEELLVEQLVSIVLLTVELVLLRSWCC